MRRILSIFVISFFIVSSVYAQSWNPAGDKIKTPWAENVDPKNPLPEYPRPQMAREQWKNLNGLWDYAITAKENYFPSSYDGKILVPFAIESSLSGVQKTVGKDNELWYRNRFTIPTDWKNKNIILHFGAVDWKTEVWVNNIKVGSHQGGYTPFSFDITFAIQKGKEQELIVKVWDPTNEGFQPRGKQVVKPRSIWYTSVTGIWQTVWIEPVNVAHITHLKIVPNIDGGTAEVAPSMEGTLATDLVEVKVLDGKTVIGTGKSLAGQDVMVPVPDAKLWSPDSPFLYNMEVSIVRNNAVVDKVSSYLGMRKISIQKDENGIVRLQLNNQDCFQLGPLDQGWWPDGLYTAPTDEALLFDIKKTKDLGFNMIRKHVKVEPARWYYHADKEGILVWQDMPSGDKSPKWQRYNYFNGEELKRSAESEQNYRQEWKEIMDLVISNPCVVTWVPFNEAWGQFKTEEIVEWTKNYDPSRLVNPASGGNHYTCGDMLDMHHYPGPVLKLIDPDRSNVLGEYGGIGMVVDGHLWDSERRNWGYVKYKTSEEVTNTYIQFAEKLKKLIPFGYSAAVYTQTTDVEGEVNGLITYDRKVIKVDESRIRKVNQEVCDFLNK